MTMQPPELAMGWDDYSALAARELSALLASGECDERTFQRLLEEHPILVPGVYPSTQAGHNGIFPSSVITQPPLTGLNTRLPDFCVISHDSGTLYASFVEIESPCKPWATKAGVQSAKLTQAIDQLRDWKIWFNDPLNAARFLDEFRVPHSLRAGRAFVRQYILVYGRREDLRNSDFGKRRAEAEAHDEVFMSWDRLQPSNHYAGLMTVRLTPDGYRAVSVPPSVTLGPLHAEDQSIILGRKEAVARSRHLSPVRAQFLIERWPYWDGWVQSKSNGNGFLSTGDVE